MLVAHTDKIYTFACRNSYTSLRPLMSIANNWSMNYIYLAQVVS